jgi:hypothetical protein
MVTGFLPILPAVLLMLTCVIVGYWNMRKIDRFLSEHPEPANPSQSSSAVDSQVRLPR